MAEELLEKPEENTETTSTDIETKEEPKGDDDLASWLDAQGGRDVLTSAKSIYDSYTDPTNFDADKFWTNLAELSESRYNAAMIDAFRKHPDAAIQVALGIKAQDIAKIKEFVAGGMKVAVASKEDGMSDAALAELDEPWAKELLENRRWRKEQETAAAEQQRRQEEADFNRLQQQIAQEYNSFVDSHEAEIDKDIAKLNLGSDEIAEAAKEAMKALALYKFFNNQASKKIYNTATGHIRNSEYRLGKQLLPQVINRQTKHTAEAVKFISDLLQPKRAEGSLKRDAATKVLNPPAGGAVAPPATSQPGAGNNVVPFDTRAQLERLRELRAARGL